MGPVGEMPNSQPDNKSDSTSAAPIPTVTLANVKNLGVADYGADHLAHLKNLIGDGGAIQLSKRTKGATRNTPPSLIRKLSAFVRDFRNRCG